MWVGLFKSLARFLDSAALRSKWQRNGSQHTTQSVRQLSRILYKSDLFYAKQSQFPEKSNERNIFYNKVLWKKLAIGHLVKTNPNKAKVNMGKIGTEWQRHIVNCIPRRSAPLCLSAFVSMNQLFKTNPICILPQRTLSSQRGRIFV